MRSYEMSNIIMAVYLAEIIYSADNFIHINSPLSI